MITHFVDGTVYMAISEIVLILDRQIEAIDKLGTESNATTAARFALTNTKECVLEIEQETKNKIEGEKVN